MLPVHAALKAMHSKQTHSFKPRACTPASKFMSVVFPAPLGPTMATRLPMSMPMLRPCTYSQGVRDHEAACALLNQATWLLADAGALTFATKQSTLGTCVCRMACLQAEVIAPGILEVCVDELQQRGGGQL